MALLPCEATTTCLPANLGSDGSRGGLVFPDLLHSVFPIVNIADDMLLAD